MRLKNYYFIEGSNLFPIEHVYLIELEAIIHQSNQGKPILCTSPYVFNVDRPSLTRGFFNIESSFAVQEEKMEESVEFNIGGLALVILGWSCKSRTEETEVEWDSISNSSIPLSFL